jgi:invasion protein IalB
MRRAPIVLTLAAAALLATACSSSIDVDSLEQQVQSGLAEQLGGTWTVQCPDSMEVQAGLTANCMATNEDGQSLNVDITQEDDQGTVSWQVVE